MSATLYRPGHFVWREILTPDPSRSMAFYVAIVGWRASEVGLADGSRYTLFRAGERELGGCMPLGGSGMRPHWALYVSVDDVDAAAARARRAGGRVVAGPRDTGDAGRFVTIADPDGAVVNAWRSGSGDGAAIQRRSQGYFAWEHLHTRDPAATGHFYGEVFGWSEAAGVAGSSWAWWAAQAAPVASRSHLIDDAAPHWLTHVVVESLETANARVRRSGGKVLLPTLEAPGVGRMSIIEDCVGARLGLLEAAT